MPPRRRTGRKLLIASIGVAAVAYGCSKDPKQPEPVGNLVAPPPATPATSDPTIAPPGNLMPPPPVPTVPEPTQRPDAGAQKKTTGKLKPGDLGF